MEGPTTCRATCCYGSSTCRATVSRWHLLYVCSRMRYVGGSPCRQATRLLLPYILDNNGDTTSLLMLGACSMSLYRGDTHLKAVSGHAGKANGFVVISYICGGTYHLSSSRKQVAPPLVLERIPTHAVNKHIVMTCEPWVGHVVA